MIVTMEDQITIIKSNLASLERQKKNENWEALKLYFESISKAALAAAEYCGGKNGEETVT